MKRVLITGANKGVGLAIAARVLSDRADTEVLLGSRDLARGQAARESLVMRDASLSTRVRVVPIDVGDDESVSAALEQVKASFPDEATPLYGIVNNAGIGMHGEDLARVFSVNVYGIKRVCSAFVPLLETKGGRIVNATSASGPNFVAQCSTKWKEFFLDPEIQWQALDNFMKDCISIGDDTQEFETRGLSDGASYGLSKACANSLSMLLALNHPDLLVNACTPGFIETDLTRDLAEAQGTTPEEMGMKPPSEGVTSALFLLFGDPPKGGHYYGSDALRSPLDRYRSPGSPAFAG